MTDRFKARLHFKACNLAGHEMKSCSGQNEDDQTFWAVRQGQLCRRAHHAALNMRPTSTVNVFSVYWFVCVED